jgi:hypothetical protein
MSGSAIRNVMYLEVKPGLEAEFAEQVGKLGVLRAARGHRGFLSGELCRTAAGSPLFALMTLWESESAYRSWLRAERLVPRLADVPALLEEPGPGDVLHVVEQRFRSRRATRPRWATAV